MILKASTTIILDESSGTIEIHRGQYFRTESTVGIMDVAVKLTSEDEKEIVRQYVDEVKNLFEATTAWWCRTTFI